MNFKRWCVCVGFVGGIGNAGLFVKSVPSIEEDEREDQNGSKDKFNIDNTEESPIRMIGVCGGCSKLLLAWGI